MGATAAQYELGEFAFPRGWFVVAESAAIGRRPCNARYFGEDVVIFRGESGAVVMLEAYCPHMGTHLGKSTGSWTVVAGRHMEGDGIRCPFHGWRFGPDGKCDDIPYFDGPIPEKARLRSWPVQERYGFVFCWNDPEGLAPDMGLPDFPEWDDPAWLRWEGLHHVGDMNTHPIEVVDNTADVAHLDLLHGTHVFTYENEVDGPYLRQRQSAAGHKSGTDGYGGGRMTTDVFYSGPGLLCARFLELELVQFIPHTPTDDGACRLWCANMCRSATGVPDAADRERLRRIDESLARGLGDDFEIWANKRPALKVMQIPTDGPFAQSRVWYSQFYNPRHRAPEILARVQGVHRVRNKPGAPATSTA